MEVGNKCVAEVFKSRPCLRQKLLMRNYVINMSRAGREKKSEYPTGIEPGLPYTGRMLKPMRYTCTIRIESEGLVG